MKKPTSGGGPVAIDWKIERGLASRPSGDGDANGDEHSRTSKRSIAIEETAVRRRKSEDRIQKTEFWIPKQLACDCLTTDY